MSASDLTTIDNVKEAIQLPDGYPNLDTTLPVMITQASKAIMKYCKRQFAPVTTTTRRFRVDGYRVDFSPWDLQPGGITVTLHPETTQPLTLTDGTSGGNAQYMMKPINPEEGVYQSVQFSGYLVIVSQTLMAFNYALVDVTGTWGFPTIPDDVIRATNITVGSWLTRSAPGATGAYGIPPMSTMGAPTFRNDWHIPWAAAKLLGEYRRGSARWAF